MGRGDGTQALDTFDFSDVVRGNVLEDEWNEEAIQHTLTGFDKYFTRHPYLRGKVWEDVALHRKYLHLLKEQDPERWEKLAEDLALFNIPRPSGSREPEVLDWMSSRIDATHFRRTSSALIVKVKGGHGKGSQSFHLRLDHSSEMSLCGLDVDSKPNSCHSLARARCKKCQSKLEKLLAGGETLSAELVALANDDNCPALGEDDVTEAVSRARKAAAERLLAEDLPSDPEELKVAITECGDRELRQTIAEKATAYLYELSPDDRLLRITFNGSKPNYLQAIRASIRRRYGSPCPWPDQEEMVEALKRALAPGLWTERPEVILGDICAQLFPEAVSDLTATLGKMPFEPSIEKMWRDRYPELLPPADSDLPDLLPV